MFLLLLLESLVTFSYQFCQRCEECNVAPAQNSLPCKCDADCGIFGDCCDSLSPPDSCPRPSLNPLLPGVVLECQSIYFNAPTNSENGSYLMVSSCPICSEDIQEIKELESNCTSKDFLLPVTDLKSGIVYRNEYCAYCNGVEELVAWQIDLVCSNNVHKAIFQSNLPTLVANDPIIFQRECQQWSFKMPHLLLGIRQPRSCIYSIKFCLSKTNLEKITGNTTSIEYEEMEYNCLFGVLDPVEGLNGLRYKNSNCAKCNAMQAKQCSTAKQGDEKYQGNDSQRSTSLSTINSLISLSAINSSTISLYTDQDTFLLNMSCSDPNLPAAFHCHSMPCPLDPSDGTKYCLDFMPVLIHCFGIFANCSSQRYTGTFNNTQNFSLYNPLGFQLSCAENTNCPDGYKLLNKSEYTDFYNGSIMNNGGLLQRWYYDTRLQVFICVDKKGNLINLICHTISHSFGLVGVLLILLTYSLFKDIRNLSATIILNYAIPSLFDSVLCLIAKYKVNMGHTVYTVFSIVLHYLSLVELTWMILFSYEVLRKFYLGLHMKKDSKKSQRYHLIAYLCAGWCPSLLLVSVIAIVNFTRHRLLQYDLNSKEVYVLRFNSFLAAEGLYALVCIAFSIVTFVIITFLMCVRASVKVKLKQKGILTLFRLWIVLDSLTCFTYIPYFINHPQWLVYIMEYYNESRGLFIFLAFFLTKKVFTLYCNLFTRIFSCNTVSSKAKTNFTSTYY